MTALTGTPSAIDQALGHPEQEEWRLVPGFGGRYEVSDLGRVRSTRGPWGVRVLSGSFDKNGYRRVALTKDSGKVAPKIHTLVLTAFVGPRPAGMECCHADGNPANNNLANLRWDTPASNCLDKARHGRTVRQPGEANPFAKLTEVQVREIRLRYATTSTSHSALAAEYGVSKAAIGMILRRESWDHLPPEDPDGPAGVMVKAEAEQTAAPSNIECAQVIRREVMEAGWPQSREAQWAIGWALGELDDVLAVRDRLLNDDLDPYAVRAPDMGLGEWDREKALEYADDEALQAADALRKRLAEFKRREEADKRGKAA